MHVKWHGLILVKTMHVKQHGCFGFNFLYQKATFRVASSAISIDKKKQKHHLHVYITAFFNFVAATYHPSVYFGQRTGPVLINNVECSGSESRLLTCSFGVAETYDTHSKDVSNRCLSG